jgi:hypothetical protein
MQGHFALVGVDDGGGMAELVIEFHAWGGILAGDCWSLIFWRIRSRDR